MEGKELLRNLRHVTCKIVSKCSKDMHKLFVGLSLISQFLKMLQHPSAIISHFILIASSMKDFRIHPYHVTPSSLSDRVSSDGKLPAAKVGQNGSTLLKTISYTVVYGIYRNKSIPIYNI